MGNNLVLVGVTTKPGVKLTVVRTLLGEGTLTVAEIAEHVQVAPSTIYRAVKGGRSALA